jgi:hypothetical protein
MIPGRSRGQQILLRIAGRKSQRQNVPSPAPSIRSHPALCSDANPMARPLATYFFGGLVASLLEPLPLFLGRLRLGSPSFGAVFSPRSLPTSSFPFVARAASWAAFSALGLNFPFFQERTEPRSTPAREASSVWVRPNFFRKLRILAGLKVRAFSPGGLPACFGRIGGLTLLFLAPFGSLFPDCTMPQSDPHLGQGI